MEIKASTDGIEVWNWEHSLVSRPSVVVEAKTVDDIVAVMKDVEGHPAPIRAIGSNHSTTRCTVADRGTMVNMRAMDRILAINEDTVTVQAGALYIDVAKELQKHGLQFHVNLEIGSLSIGTAACGGTKDSSMPGEYGQVNSYAVGMKLVKPSGELVEVGLDQPELLWIMRSSYGLLGILYEVTFKVRPLQALSIEHKTFSLERFEQELPTLQARDDSMFMYVTPFLNRVTVEFRKYGEGQPPETIGWRWWLRNFFWKKIAPYIGYLGSKYMPIKAIRYFIINMLNWVQIVAMITIMRAKRTAAADQIIRFPPTAGNTKYSFSIWAFPEASFPRIMREYFEFCQNYYREHGYRCNLLNVGYRISKDNSSLFSYSQDGGVMTVDPVATGDPGWQEFLVAYNDFCSTRGASPLFNQTRSLTPAQARLAFGDRLDTFNTIRKTYDPEDRLLNEYFASMFSTCSL